MKKIDRRIVIVVSLIFIVGLSYGIMKFLIAQKEEPPQIRLLKATRYVRALVISYGEVMSPISEQGRMASISQVDLSAEASGKIEAGDIMLKKGASFKKGDIIFSIYSDEAALALKARKSQFMNSVALLLPDISIDYPSYEDVFTSFFKKLDTENPLPVFPIVEDNQLKIYLASKNILSEYYSIRKDELQLSRHVIIAPFNGTLTEVYLEVGAYTNTGGKVASCINTDLLELEVPLIRADAHWVHIGDPVEIQADNSDEVWKGTVIRKSQVVDETTQSQVVFVRVHNSGKALLAGEYLTASFSGRPVKGVMEIPRNAVFNSNVIFIVKNKRLVKEEINIIKVNTNSLLFNGPAEGDTLVTQSLINVFEGTRVTTSLDEIKNEIGKKSGPQKSKKE